MNFSNKIAWRYVKSKKSAQAINIISKISMIAIMFSSAAMIILFSVYNGIEGITKDLYTAFYPDIKITPQKGKYFEATRTQVEALDKMQCIDLWSYTLEDMALILGAEEQKIAIVKGVNNDWIAINNLNKYIIEGDVNFNENNAIPQAIVGVKLANALSLATNNIFSNISIFYPKTGVTFSQNTDEVYNNINAQPTAIFRVASMLDEKYVILPISAASKLMGKFNHFSTIDIKLKPGVTYADAKKELSTAIDTKTLNIQDKYEQNKTLFMILNSEKWAIYAILLMVMIVASFNMIGSLTMLVLEKKHDIAILKSLGATNSNIRNIFLRSGLYLSFIGGGAGLVLGYLICFSQQQWGWISMGSGFVVDTYPIAFEWGDFILVLASIIIIGLLASIFPATKASKSAIVIKDE